MLKNDLIYREKYIKDIRPFIGVNMIKIISGVRRCGKSYLLDMIGDELLSLGISKEHIIYRLYTSVEIADGFDKADMFAELSAILQDNDKYYFLLDEVQEIDGWEQAVNTLYETGRAEIYVTGSNSKLSAEGISSYLSGRYVEIPVYTLSFDEYIDFAGKKEMNRDDAYREYARTGGFPIIAVSGLNIDNSYQIIEGIYQSIINKDVLSNHPIKDIEKFNRVVKYIMDNVGKTFSAKSISDYLKSQQRSISVESIYNYLSWLEDAYIIYRCNRYDMKGKEILKTQEKFYLSDISLRYALFGYSRTMDDSILENIIYLELRRRGYTVFVGKNGTKEIDFVAKKHGQEIHIQAAVRLPVDSDREIGNLLEIQDHCHKYVVTTDRNDCETVDGIRVIHVADFLGMDEW